jgi:hypothetical protein
VPAPMTPRRALAMRTIALASGSVVLLTAAAALGATLRGLTLEDLVLESAAVVRGHVVAQTAARDPLLGLVRESSIAVDEVLAGEAAATVEVVLLGGIVGDAGTHVPGEATLAIGDEVLVFLADLGVGDGRMRVTGMAQGVFRVVRDEATGAAFAARELGDVALVGEPRGDDLGLARPCSCTFVPLERLESLIRKLAGPR